MRKIKFQHIILASVSLTLFCVCLIAGSFKWPSLILSTLFLILYILMDRKFLRCPHCSSFINLDRLLFSRTHVYHCPRCGEIIEIEK